MRKLFILLSLLAIVSCSSVTNSSDDIQRTQQEAILKEATAQIRGTSRHGEPISIPSRLK